jgi:nucleoside-diphosphate-sugar epimerase
VKTIIGSGLLATNFGACTFSRSCLILASGVSNSNEHREAEFRRESETISAAMRAHPSSRVIYFSTCSILQQTQTPYIRHKLDMESLVAAKASSFQIYRLPQVVGPTRNLTLVSYLVESVLLRRRVSIQRHAKRNLVDVNDVSRLIHQLVERDIGINTTQSLAATHGVHVIEVLQTIGGILDIEPQFDLVDAGESYAIPTAFMRQHFGPDDALMKPDYWQTVLRTHVPAIASKIRSAA